MTVTLSPDVIAMIEARMAARGYESADDLVRYALTLLDAEPGIEEDEEWLRQAIQEGLESGEPVEVDPEELKSHIIRGTPLRPR